jgi:dCMP deaminase
MTRSSWDAYFLSIARTVATRATCPRKSVGAVIVESRTIIATGYNGSIRGHKHCTEVGCDMENGHCVRTVHAEANAIVQAANAGVSIYGADIYTTARPCWPCYKFIANAGIRNVYYLEEYGRDPRMEDEVLSHPSPLLINCDEFLEAEYE